MELSRDRLKVVFSSNSIIREIFIETQSAEGKKFFYLLSRYKLGIKLRSLTKIYIFQLYRSIKRYLLYPSHTSSIESTFSEDNALSTAWYRASTSSRSNSSNKSWLPRLIMLA